MPSRGSPAGKDGNGVSLLHKDMERHFERLAVFLAFRNAFTEEEMNEGAISKSQATSIKKTALLLYPSRRHLIPTTTPKRLRQVLQALLDIDAFATGSEVRASFSDITDEQIWTRDPKIVHRLPLTEGGAEMSPPATSKSHLGNENIPYPGSSARCIEASPSAPEILDDTGNMKPIPKGPKVTAPTEPRIIPRRPRGNGLTQENLSQFNIFMGEDRSFYKPLGSIQVCRSEENLSQLHVSQAADSGVHQPLGSGQMSKPPLDISNNRLGGNKWSVEQPTRPNQPILPFKLQIAVLATTQQLLEEACFYFAEKWLPALLKTMKWDVPEKGELHIWWRAIQRRSVPADAVNFGVLDVEGLFRQASEIRHHAVHRKDCPLPRLQMFLQNALLILQGLLDDPRAAKLQKIQTAFNNYDFALIEETLQMPLQHHPDSTNHQIEMSDSKEGLVDRPAKRQRVQSPNLPGNPMQLKLGNELVGKEIIDLTQDSDEDMT